MDLAYEDIKENTTDTNKENTQTMRPSYDLTDERFGRLVALHRSIKTPSLNNNIVWTCICDCGNFTDVRSSDLKSGRTKSCGCLHKEIISKHNLPRDRLYSIWRDMRQRCNNPKCSLYKNYGGRGISVCTEWDNYENFHAWAMKSGYEENLTIDRIDVNGNYEPSNCRWATKIVQENNRRNNRFGLYKGEKMSVSDFSRLKNIPRRYIYTHFTNDITFDEIELSYLEKYSHCTEPTKYSSIEIAKQLRRSHSEILNKMKSYEKKNNSFANLIHLSKYKTYQNNVFSYYEIDQDCFDEILLDLKSRSYKKDKI